MPQEIIPTQVTINLYMSIPEEQTLKKVLAQYITVVDRFHKEDPSDPVMFMKDRDNAMILLKRLTDNNSELISKGIQ